jgi:hypothetical protein
MNRNAGWLVQHKHQPVAMEHAGEQIFWIWQYGKVFRHDG